MVQKVFAGLALGVGSAAVVLLLAATGLLDTAEMKSYDHRMQWAAKPESVSKDIVLVEINDSTIRDMEPLFGHWPWPRLALSYVIDYLHRAPAKVVAIDISFPERDRVVQYDIGGDKWSGQQSDQALADSVKASGNVIMLVDAIDEGLLSGESNTRAGAVPDAGYRVASHAEPRPIVLPPYKELADASAGFGHNFLGLDVDGPARRMAPFIQHDGVYVPSLGVATALKAGAFRPDEVSSSRDAIIIRDRHVPLVTSNSSTLTTAQNSTTSGR